jgi:Fe-S cluster assembly iron-binding protein IscA
MLIVTRDAVTVFNAAKASLGAPTEAGVRIIASPSANHSSKSVLNLGFAIDDDPAFDDEEFEQDGLRFFLKPDLADTLDGHVLDVEETSEGPSMVLYYTR